MTHEGQSDQMAEHYDELVELDTPGVDLDNALAYRRSGAFRDALGEIGAVHKRTRPYRPQTNGKVERFHQTLLRGWAYKRPYDTTKPAVPHSPGSSTHTIRTTPQRTRSPTTNDRPRHPPLWEGHLGPSESSDAR